MTNAEMVTSLLRKGDFVSVFEVFCLYAGRILTRIDRFPEICYGKIAVDERIAFPLATTPLVSIIIPIHNQWAMTHSCLYALRRHDEGIPCEIIIADDASSDQSCEIERLVSGIRVSRQESNIGFLHNCNAAARMARGRYLLFLNNDTNVQPGWLGALVDLLEGEASIGMAGPKFLYPGGRLQEAGCIVWNDGSAWTYGRWDDPARPKYNREREVDYVAGACFLIRKTLWDKIGGFDVRYTPAYCEDADLAFEVRLRGFRVVYQPLSVVVHFEGTSYGTDTRRGLKLYQVINQKKFVEKWQEVLLRDHFPPGTLRAALHRRRPVETRVTGRKPA